MLVDGSWSAHLECLGLPAFGVESWRFPALRWRVEREQLTPKALLSPHSCSLHSRPRPLLIPTPFAHHKLPGFIASLHLAALSFFVVAMTLLPSPYTVDGPAWGVEGLKTDTRKEKLGSHDLGSLMEKPQDPRNLACLLYTAEQRRSYCTQLNEEAGYCR